MYVHLNLFVIADLSDSNNGMAASAWDSYVRDDVLIHEIANRAAWTL